MRDETFAWLRHKLAADGQEVFVGSDLSWDTWDRLGLDADSPHPRAYHLGIAEQAIVGLSAGLALTGMRPYVMMISAFLLRRGIEQVVLDVGVPDLQVAFLGQGGGLEYAHLGLSHTMQNDWHVASQVPNMRIWSAAFAADVAPILSMPEREPHPAYLRVQKWPDAPMCECVVGRELHPVRVHRPPAQVCVVSTGILGRELCGRLHSQPKLGLVEVVRLHPFPAAELSALLANCDQILVAEECWPGVVEDNLRRLGSPPAARLVNLLEPPVIAKGWPRGELIERSWRRWEANWL